MSFFKKLLTCCTSGMLLSTSIFAQPHIITTIAGDGIHGYTGDGGSATMAELYSPNGQCVDKHGNVYIADQLNNRIRKVTPEGIITTFMGTGISGFNPSVVPVASAYINPTDIAIDTFGNFYVTDYNFSCVYKIDTGLMVHLIAGTSAGWGYTGDSGPATAAQLNRPNSIAVDYAGNIYIADVGNSRVRVINTAGVINTLAGNGTSGFTGDGGPATAAELGTPWSVGVDKSGSNVFIADGENNMVRKVVTATGIISAFAGTGTPGYSGDGGAANAAELNDPWGIAVDTLGNVYIGDIINARVRVVSPFGIINEFAGNGVGGFGGDDGNADSCEFSGIYGLAVNGNGSVLYVADQDNQRIRKVFNNFIPEFTGGNTLHLTVCENSLPTNIDTLLEATDSDLYQNSIWYIVSTPMHGVFSGTYSAATVGGIVVPVGMTYMPYTGFTGFDTFKMAIGDGYAYDTAMVIVQVLGVPVGGTITGTDSVCVGFTDTLHDTTGSGVWTVSSGTVASVSTMGVVTGLAVGTDTVVYTNSNVCGIAHTSYIIHVQPASLLCYPLVTSQLVATANSLELYPQPNRGTFTVTCNQAVDDACTLTITNTIGQRVYEIVIPTNQKTEIYTQLADGVYEVNVTSHHAHFTGKLVVTQ